MSVQLKSLLLLFWNWINTIIHLKPVRDDIAAHFSTISSDHRNIGSYVSIYYLLLLLLASYKSRSKCLPSYNHVRKGIIFGFFLNAIDFISDTLFACLIGKTNLEKEVKAKVSQILSANNKEDIFDINARASEQIEKLKDM